MSVFRLLASLGLNTASYEAGMKRVTSLTTRWGSALAASTKSWIAGAFGAYAIAQATRRAAEYASTIKDLSDTTGLSTTTLQEWGFAAARTGATLDDFTRSFNKLQRDNPNLTLEQTLELFNKISRTVSGGALGPSGNAALVFERFGRSGMKLLPALTEGLASFSAQANRLGMIATPEQIANVDRLTDSIESLSEALTMRLVPVMATALEKAEQLFGGASALFKFIGKGGATSGAQGFLTSLPKQYWLSGMMSQMLQKFGMDVTGATSAFGEGFLSVMLKQISKVNARRSQATSAELAPKSMMQEAAKASFSMLLPETTERQRIGAYSGATPVFVMEQRKQTNLLQRIADATAETTQQLEP